MWIHPNTQFTVSKQTYCKVSLRIKACSWNWASPKTSKSKYTYTHIIIISVYCAQQWMMGHTLVLKVMATGIWSVRDASLVTMLNLVMSWNEVIQISLSVFFFSSVNNISKETCYTTHAKHRFPAPSSKLCQIWLHHWRGTLYLHAASCPLMQSAPSKRFGYWYDCRSNLAPKHAHKHKKSPISIQMILVSSELA